MKIYILFFSILLLMSCNHSEKKYKNELLFFANNFQLIAETKNDVPTLSARIFTLREFGECDNKKCPNEYVYIAISEFGEYPKQKLYISEKSHEWSFLKWDHIPDVGEKNPSISFRLKSIINGIKTVYTVNVSLKSINYINSKK